VKVQLPQDEGTRFFGWLLVATLTPFVCFPLSTLLLDDLPALHRVNAALLFIGSSGHVAASFFFYSEPRMRRHMLAEYPARFLVAPVVLLVGLGAFGFYVGGGPLSAYLIVGYWIWQTHHYNRQNHGILSFVSRAVRRPVRLRERLAVTLAGVAAVTGMITYVPSYLGTPLAAWGWQLEWTSLGIFAAAWICYLPSLLEGSPRATPWRTLMLLALMLFYLPLFLFDDMFTAVMTYAIAHGLQYHVFMVFVAGSPRETRGRALGSLVAWALLGGAVLHVATSPAWIARVGPTIYALGLAVVMWHFLLDAGVWRLSERFQREYMAERFRFL
jgi:hypothetical protein